MCSLCSSLRRRLAFTPWLSTALTTIRSQPGKKEHVLPRPAAGPGQERRHLCCVFFSRGLSNPYHLKGYQWTFAVLLETKHSCSYSLVGSVSSQRSTDHLPLHPEALSGSRFKGFSKRIEWAEGCGTLWNHSWEAEKGLFYPLKREGA